MFYLSFSIHFVLFVVASLSKQMKRGNYFLVNVAHLSCVATFLVTCNFFGDNTVAKC